MFTLSTNFPIIAITLRNNLDSILSEAAPRVAALAPALRRLLFPSLAILPPALVALATEDLGILVSITGNSCQQGNSFTWEQTDHFNDNTICLSSR